MPDAGRTASVPLAAEGVQADDLRLGVGRRLPPAPSTGAAAGTPGSGAGKRRPKRACGSAKAVSALKGTTSVEGTPPKDSPTEKLPAPRSTFRSQKFVLQDDGHFLRVARLQVARDGHAGEFRAEGNVEMVLARQAAAAGMVQRLDRDGAQRFLRPFGVGQ